ncbi:MULTISPECIES: hypothetical protein [Acidiphilium]|uniref:hypothetical protein n=1 Tax=Acidiphilium TaxID=522 RepID=UPI00110F79FA|nr:MULTISPECIES: hypothetical protein [Acidiphilium]MBS3025620.1 hypothetical protein [Acidiphilium multivorum]MBU6355751.1 hypothetical protein [Rhodospirillales bacterium]
MLRTSPSSAAENFISTLIQMVIIPNRLSGIASRCRQNPQSGEKVILSDGFICVQSRVPSNSGKHNAVILFGYKAASACRLIAASPRERSDVLGAVHEWPMCAVSSSHIRKTAMDLCEKIRLR